MRKLSYNDKLHMQMLWQQPAAWFTQNDWASVVDLTADFLNNAHLSPFVKATENNGWLSHQILAHKASAYAVCHSKTIFPLVGLTKLYSYVCKTLLVKNQTFIYFYNYRTLRHTMTKMALFSEKLVHCIFILWVNTQNLTGWKW